MQKNGTREKTAALALCVSLWIAGGGVAGAKELYLDANNNNAVTHDSDYPQYAKVTSSAKNLSVSREGGFFNLDFSGWNIYGGKGTGALSGYGLDLTRANKVGNVYGARTSGGAATGNKVDLKLQTKIAGNVYGGYSENGGDTSGNTVCLTNEKLEIGGDLMGGNNAATVTGNTLEIKAQTETVTGTVGNFAKITFYQVGFSSGNTVLTAGHFANWGTLDITEAGFNVNSAGAMTLLSSGTANDFASLALKYSGGTATLNSANPSVVVKRTAVSDSTTVSGATLDYDSVRHTVSISAADSYKTVKYTIAKNLATKLAFGDVDWDEANALIDHSTTWNTINFNSDTAIDTSKLAFTNPEAIAKDDSMILLANATGLTAGDAVAHTQAIEKTADNGAKLSATLTGNVTREADAVGYTVTSMTLDSVNLANWNGTTGSVPTGWTASLANNSITAAGFTAPNVAAGASKDILTTTTNNFFNNNQITGAMKYAEDAESSDTVNGVTLTGAESKGVKASADGKSLVYARSNFNVSSISLGEMTWNTGRTAATGYDFANTETVNVTNLSFKNPEAVTGSMTLLSDATNLASWSNSTHTQNFTKTMNGATLSATLSGNVIRATAGQIGYTATGTALTGVNLANWNGTTGEVPTGWTASLAADSITAAGFTAPTLEPETSKAILTTTTENFFADSQITGALKYQPQTFTEETATNGVTFSGKQSRGVTTADGGKNLVYTAGKMNVENISFGEMTWGTARDASGTAYDYAGVTDANLNVSGLTFTNPEDVTGTTTLLAANNSLMAALVDVAKPVSYQYNPVAGVTVEGAINGSVSKDGANIVYTATENRANKLTFGDVDWKDSGALMTRPANITFAGADVDTTNINFTNIQSLEANKKMTLVSDFGNSVGTITGTKYKVGSTLEGTGKASLVGNDLIFTAETGTSQEQTHNTVMGAEVGMAALSAGNDFVGTATDGLAMTANVGADGVSSFANMGGGSIRQETGSHIDAHTWNAIIALGHANKKERSTFEYGAFFEYGTGNYTTHNGDERGDGSTHYTGGGLLAKWTAKHGLYVEGSLRAGSVHDDARNVLRDVNGVPYSYETNAPYMGFHLGVGKEIRFDDIHSLDVYGKYFYNRRNGVSFDAGGHYDLDAVTSQTVRVGARYIVKRDKWNLYGGLAYEHELDGKATGKADGVPIRGADTSGGSLRGEIGATMKPSENSPWSLDLNLSGFAGKKRGFTGGVSVAFMF